MTLRTPLFVLALATAFPLAACGKKKSHDTGTASAALANGTPAALDGPAPATPTPSTAAATVAQLKITSIQLISDVDSNGNFVGDAPYIYIAPTCSPTTDSDGTKGLGPGLCPADSLSYFDINRPSAAVNADLNSQGLTVPAGTYKYVQISFNGTDTPTKPTVKFQTSAMTAPFEFVSSMNATRSAAANPPITVNKGDTVVVTLTYDLSQAIIVNGAAGTIGGGNGVNCTRVSGSSYCWGYPALTPSFSRNGVAQN